MATSQEVAFRGNKTGQEFPEDWKNSVIVELWKEEFFMGGFVEVTGSRMFQTYSPADFDKLSEERADGKSFFTESQFKVKIHHDPRS